MKYIFFFILPFFLVSCITNTSEHQTETSENVIQKEKQTITYSLSGSQSGFVLPSDYSVSYEDKNTGIGFYYPNTLHLIEDKESGGWEMSATGAKQNEVLIHTLTLTGTTDNSILYFALPDHTSPTGGAPHIWISENQVSLHGNTLTRELAWVTQSGTGTTDVGSWEITYKLGDKYIQIIQGDEFYGSGYIDSISQRTEEVAQNILMQL